MLVLSYMYNIDGFFFFTLIKNPISISSNTDVLVISKFLTCASGNSHAEWEVDA